MASRREFIGASFALSVAGAAGASLFPPMAAASEPRFLRLDRFVFDHRFPEGVEIGRILADQGLRPTGFAGDLSHLWYDCLDLEWKNQPRALAGVTKQDALFVLETLAADRRMRVVYRGVHESPLDGYAAHSLAGPKSLLARATPGAEGASWEALIGRALTQCPLGAPVAGELSMTTRVHGPVSRVAPLVSWIIAPRTSVALTV